MRPVVPVSDRSHGAHLLVYLGIMGPQDNVEVALDVVAVLVQRRGRTDVRAALLGFGDCLADLRARSTRMGLDDVVEFTGRVGPEQIGEYLSVASVGLGPDRKTPLNDVSTMNKTMEYMAYAVVPVSFDLVETAVSAGQAGVSVPSGDVEAFADAIEAVLDDEDRRVAMSLAARERAVAELDWSPQSRVYVEVFDRLLGGPPRKGAPDAEVDAGTGEQATSDRWGRRYVTSDRLEDFVRSRGPRRRPVR
jgi:glycosyltransferase involved in cell wall biosynthesis